MKRLLLLLALVFTAGCVGSGAKIDINNGVVIEKFTVDPKDIFDFQTATFSVDVSNVGGTTANDVKVRLFGVEGAWRQASGSGTVSEVKRDIGTLKPPSLKDNIPGDSRFTDFTLTAPDLNEGDRTSFPVKARVEFTYSTSGTVIIKAISLKQQQILQRKGETVLEPVKESNSEGPLKFAFVRGATPLVIDADEGDTIDREFRFEISNVGQGWPISDDAVGKVGSASKGNKIEFRKPSGVTLVGCEGINGGVDGFSATLRSEGKAPISCTVRIDTRQWGARTEESLIFNVQLNYKYFVESEVAVNVQGSKRGDLPARAAPGTTPLPGVAPGATPAPGTVPPSSVSTSPSSGATVAATTNSISMPFNKEIDVASISGSVSVTGSKEAGPIAGATSLSADQKTLIFTPTAGLQAGSTYTVTVAKSLKSRDGVNLADVITFTFSTAVADTTAPTLTRVAPDLDAVLTTRTPTISMKTNEAATCKIVSSGQTLSTTNDIDHTLTLTLTADGQQSLNIRCKDNANNENAATNDLLMRFTIDSTAPTVTAKSPEVSGASKTPDITITFSEKMSKATIASAFSLKAGTTAVAIGSPLWSADDLTVTFRPSAALAGSTEHTVTLSTNAKDLAGNSLASAVTFSFTTTA